MDPKEDNFKGKNRLRTLLKYQHLTGRNFLERNRWKENEIHTAEILYNPGHKCGKQQ